MCVYLHYFLWLAPKADAFEICRSRSSKVIDFGRNRKHACNFLLVPHSNLGPILSLFRDIAGFLSRNWPHPPKFGVFRLDQIANVDASRGQNLKLISREIIFEVFQPTMYVIRVSQRRDGQTTCRGLTVLFVASRGKIFRHTYIHTHFSFKTIYRYTSKTHPIQNCHLTAKSKRFF